MRHILHVAIAASLTILALGSVALARPPSGATRVPHTIDLEGCVLPSDACNDKPTVETLAVIAGDDTVQLKVTRARVVIGSVLAATLLREMTLRPLRTLGPEEIIDRIVPGAEIRIRSVVRLSTGILLVQSVDVISEATGSDDEPETAQD